MSELLDRRARKKAQTRAEIRRAAQELFAERGFDSVTIADIAAVADVAVQTVFNHFPTKEELFFDERTPWVDGPADVVRSRPAGTPPLTALREWTAAWICEAAGRRADDERRCYLSTLAASPSLRLFELNLQQRAEQRLRAALAEAWAADTSDGPHVCGGEFDVQVAAALTAALWVAGARTLLIELRGVHQEVGDPDAVRTAVSALARTLFARLERGLGTLLGLETGELAEAAVRFPGPELARPTSRRAG